MIGHNFFRDKKINMKILLRNVIIIVVVALLVVASLLAINIYEHRQSKLPVAEVTQDTVTYNGQEYTKKFNIETLLFIGLDKYEDEIISNSYNNDQRADFLMLFVIDNKNKELSAIHINRDTMAEYNILGVAGEKVGTITAQLALSHTYGDGDMVSCRNTAEAVSGVLNGFKIDKYISVTMDSVPEFNDLVGGVEVEVLDDFTGIDDTLQKGETVTLMGEHALNYVRTRFGLSDSTNKSRMERQQQYLFALQEKIHEAKSSDVDFVLKAMNIIDKYMVSNCSVADLESKFNKISDYTFDEIYDIEGEYVLGEKNIEFYPDEESLEEVIMSALYSPVNQ